MENQNAPPDQSVPDDIYVGNVIPFRRAVPPLTDDEITRLRALLLDAERVLVGCPVARKVLASD